MTQKWLNRALQTGIRDPRWARARAVFWLLSMVACVGLVGFGMLKVQEGQKEGLAELRNELEAARLLGRIERDLVQLVVMGHGGGSLVMPEQMRVSLRQHTQTLAELPTLSQADRERVEQLREFTRRWVENSSASSADPAMDRLLQFTAALQREWGQRLDERAAKSARSEALALWLVRGLWAIALIATVTFAVLAWRAFGFVLSGVRREESDAAKTMELSPDGLMVFGEDGRMRKVNPALETLMGQPARKLVGHPVDELIPGLLGGARQRLIPRTVLGRKIVSKNRSLSLQATLPNGGSLPVDLTVGPWSTNNSRGILVTVRAGNLGKGASSFLRQALEEICGEIGDRYLLRLAEVSARAFGCTHAAVMDLADSATGTYEVIAMIENGNHTSGEVFRYQNSFVEAMPSSGFRLVKKRARDEHPLDPLLRRWNTGGCIGIALSRNPDELPRGILLVATAGQLPELNIDVETECALSRRAAAELQHREGSRSLAAEKECLALTLRSIADGMITTDPDGQVLMINPTAERLTGYAETEAIGRNLSEVFTIQHEITRSPLPGPLEQLTEAGARTSATSVILVSADRGESAVQYSVAPVQGRDGSIAGYVLVFHDLTEARIADEERYRAERLESIGVLAGGIAHDFNNLLTGIVGNISLALANTSGDSMVQTRLKDAENASLRAKELSAQLLTFSKGGAPVRRPGPLRKVLEDTVHFSVRGDQVQADVDVASDLLWAEIDESQISQVVANLVINAQQAMPLGGRIKISASNFAHGGEDPNIGLPAGRYLRLVFEDEGTGIPPKYLKRIFDPYFTTKPKGSGLGLATSYSIVRNHQGVLTVHSEMGVGTRFDIYLPAVDPLPEQAPKPAPDFHVVRESRVLVMDDEEIICDLVAGALVPLGFSVDARHDSGSALEAYRKELEKGHPYDLVILDLTLPGDLGGQEVMQRLIEMHPEVTAIVSSGYANTPIMGDFRSYGFSGALPKPYRVADLMSKVEEVLELAERKTRAA